MKTNQTPPAVRANGVALTALILASSAWSLLATATLQLEFKYEESGSTATNTGALTAPMTMRNSANADTDLHGAPGSGLLGGTDRAFDLTSATAMGSSGTGPWGYVANSAVPAGASWTAATWYKATTTALGLSARVLDCGNDATCVLGGGGSAGSGRVFTSSGTVDANGAYPETGTWVFFATTYSNGFVSFFKGTPTTPVTLVAGPVSIGSGGANPLSIANGVSVGNRSARNRPFQGYLDNTRFWNDGGAGDTSGALSLEVLEAIRQGDLGIMTAPIPNQPLASPSSTVWEGTTITLTATTTGGLPTSYQWQKDGANLNGATMSTLVLTNATPGDSGAYTAEVGNSAGTNISPSLALTVRANIAPLFLEEPASATRYLGGMMVFSPVIDGPPPFTYQWRQGGVVLAGATNSILMLTNLTSGQAGGYTLSVTNAFGQATSAEAVLTTIAPSVGSYEEMVVTNKPFAYWRLDEPDPTSPPTAFDYLGGNDLSNNVVTASPGPQPPTFTGMTDTNSAAAYNGFNSGSQSRRPLMNTMTNWTLCGWFNAGFLPQPSRTALFGQDGQAELGFHTSTELACYVPAVGGGGVYAYSTPTLTPGQWYFVAATRNGNSLTVFLNGAPMATATGTMANPNTATPFRIGFGTIDAFGNYFNGAIDEVALFDRALSPAQVNAFFSKGAGLVAPTVTADPVGKTLYAGRGATFQVQAIGTDPLTYKWMKDGSYLTNGPRISGATTSELTISNLNQSDDGFYMVEVSNPAGTAYSMQAQLVVLPAPAAPYDSHVLGFNPLGYWSLNEPFGPVAYDYCGARDGTYGNAASMGDSVPGPRSPEFYGFSGTNTALASQGTANSAVVIPPLGITTTNFTLVAWINPADLQTWKGIVYTRGSSGNVAGFNLAGTANELHYTWKDTYWDWNTGLVLPGNSWSFAALVVEPSKATLYVGTPGKALASAVNQAPHEGMTFSSALSLGQDSGGGGYFNGRIDEVSVFNRSLTKAEVESLYANGSGVVSLSIARSGGNAVLTWPLGTLQAANEVTGTYTNVTGATSPWSVTPNEARKFYRVTVP